MGSGKSFLFLAFLFSTTLFAVPSRVDEIVAKAHSRQLSHKKEWLRLGHYKGRTSQADGMDFFNAPNGKHDPDAELEGTIRALTGEVGYCRFPARLDFLRRHLPEINDIVKPRVCPKFEMYRETLAARSVSLVFSSYYLNNPASAFGHTFLRINKADSGKEGRRFELLDHGINYAATVTVENPILYAIYGIFGLFEGHFTRVPYYYKVREYNDYESRDLWTYDLNLSPEQVNRLVLHLWELGSTYFDYYYITENCSYHILSSLEPVMPDDVELTDGLPYVVVPVDTVRAIAAVPGLLKQVSFRPALRTVFDQRLALLDGPETDALEETINAEKPGTPRLAELPPQSRAAVLDAAMDYVDFMHFKELIKEEENAPARWKQKLLVARSQVPVVTGDVVSEPTLSETPHKGHATGRVGLDVGQEQARGATLGVSWRLALHDLLDPMGGYPDIAQIEFFRTRLLLLADRQQVKLDDFSFFRVISLSPWNRFSRKMTWKVNVGAQTIRDESCPYCLGAFGEVGGGLTLRPFPLERLFVTFTMDTTLALTSAMKSFARPGFGPTLGIKAGLSADLNFLVQGGYRYYLFTPNPHSYLASAEARWRFLPDLALNLAAFHGPLGTEGNLGLFVYF